MNVIDGKVVRAEQSISCVPTGTPIILQRSETTPGEPTNTEVPESTIAESI